MDNTLWFCTNCGAGNDKQQQDCFACQQTRSEEQSDDPPRFLQDRYRIISIVGRGGFGVVYRAVDMKENNQPVAIKQITMRGLSTTEIIEATDAFHREVKLLSNLHHSSLPRIHDRFTDPDNWYIVMDFVQGETLEQYLLQRALLTPSGKPLLPLEEILTTALLLCEILTYLHTRQPSVIFRDLKPSNIVRASKDRLFLIDFGTARRHRPGQRKDTIPLGSPGYAAPEQYGRTQTTPQSDIYSLGALLHYMLSGQDPADNPILFTPLRTSESTVEQALSALVMRMVEKEVEKRPERIQDVSDELQQFLDQLTENRPRGYRPQALPRPHPPVQSIPQPPAWHYATGIGQQQQMQQQQQMHTPLPQKQPSQTSRRVVLAILGIVGAGMVGNALGALTQFNTQTAGEPPQAAAPQQKPPPPSSVALNRTTWSRNGKHLAFQYSDGSVQVFETNPQELGTDTIGTRIFGSKPNFVHQPVALSPDGTRLAAITRNDTNQATFQILSLTPGSSGMRPFAVKGDVMHIAWSSDGNRVATIGTNYIVHIWNAHTGDHLSAMWSDAPTTPHVDAPIRLQWSPDNTLILFETAPKITEVWNVAQRQLMFKLGGITTSIASWSADSKYVAITDGVRILVHSVSSSTPTQPAFILNEHYQTANQPNLQLFQPVAISYSPNGQYMAAYFDELMQIWDTTTAPYKLVQEMPIERIENPLTFDLSWSPDGKTLQIASDDQIVDILPLP